MGLPTLERLLVLWRAISKPNEFFGVVPARGSEQNQPLVGKL